MMIYYSAYCQLDIIDKKWNCAIISCDFKLLLVKLSQLY